MLRHGGRVGVVETHPHPRTSTRGGALCLSEVCVVVGEEVLRGGGFVAVDVENALPLRHDRGHEGLASHVHGGAAHVEDRVDREQQANALQGQAEGGQG